MEIMLHVLRVKYPYKYLLSSFEERGKWGGGNKKVQFESHYVRSTEKYNLSEKNKVSALNAHHI